MKTVNAFVLFGSLAAAACAWAPSALADNLGSPVDVGGGQHWTVGNLQPSTDAIPYQPAGSLWEATATSQLAGGGIPVIPGFAANSATQSFPVLWGVASAQGINPASLPAGGSASGKIYFDVTGGAAPNSVSYSVDGQQVANWVQPPPPADGAAPAYTAPRATAPMTMPAATAPAATAPAATAPAATAPAAAAPAPAAAGSSGTPAPAAAGSSGTPLPASGSSGTPLPAEGSTAATTPSAAAATPSAAAAPAPASASATPAPASTAPAAPVTPTTTSTAPR